MITELKVGYALEVDGFVFTLTPVAIEVKNLDGDTVAILPALNDAGVRNVRTQEQFEVQVAFWLIDNDR